MTDRDPLDESNHADRFDRNGYRWVWCEQCSAWCRYWVRRSHQYAAQRPTVASMDDDFGPLTFAPQPANTSPQPASDDLPASQPEPDQQDTPNPDKPSKALPPEIDAALTRALADAWDEGAIQAVEFDRSWRYAVTHGEPVPAKPTNPYRQEKS